MKPTVSIIIPAYNRADFLKEAIASAQGQTFTDTEIIVVDDGSTDGTSDYLKSIEGITVIRQENAGIAAARNRGVKAARGRYIGFLDSDDQWLPEKTDDQVRYLDAHPECAFVYSGARLIDARGEVISERRLQPNEETTYECLYEKNRIISFSISLIRKSCLDDVGWLDESLPQSTDYDLWLRLAKKYPFGYVDTIGTLYRVHDNNISGNLEGRIKAHLHTFKKKELMGDRSWRERRLRKAAIYFQVANQYFSNMLYRKGADCYTRAVMCYPAIGVHKWKYMYRKESFAKTKRFFKVYHRIGQGWLKGDKRDVRAFQQGKQSMVSQETSN